MFDPPETDADVVVLAGDIFAPGRKTPAAAVEWAKRTFDVPVVLVKGNHEYWGSGLGRIDRKMEEAARGTNVHVLENQAVVIDGVRFLGGTLWTDYNLLGNSPVAMTAARVGMNDFRYIRDDAFRRIRPEVLAARHAQTLGFLVEHVETPFNGRTVVVTHHAPSELCLPDHHRQSGELLSAAYASRLEYLMGDGREGKPVAGTSFVGGDRLAAWIHGHTHFSVDLNIAGTRVLCNPRGYSPKHLNPTFDPGRTIEI